MNSKIKYNEHIQFIKDLPAIMALYNFINELNTKYNITDNSFGIIYPEQIARDTYDGSFLKLMGVDSDTSIYSLPLTGPKTVIDISQRDYSELIKLRQLAKDEFTKDKIPLSDLAIDNLPLIKKTFNVPPIAAEYGDNSKFVVEYNKSSTDPMMPHFITSYTCNKSKGQAQEDMDHNHPAYKFYKKWNILHCRTLTIPEWNEMYNDVIELEHYCMDNK